MKFKLLTHNDLDAAGCAILAKLSLEDCEVEYFQSPDKVSERLVKMMTFQEDKFEYEDYDMVFVCDISFNENVAIAIDKSGLGKKIRVFDHHPTAKHLDIYDWATIRIEYYPGRKACGTSLFYDYFAIMDIAPVSYCFVNLIREYDTWEWETKNNKDASYLANLCGIYGINNFINKYINFFKTSGKGYAGPRQIFSASDIKAIEVEQDKIERYINGKCHEIIETEIDGYKAAVLFAESYHSELGNEVSKRYPQYDLVALVNFSRGGVSFRTRKDEVNVSLLAKKYGGGGHPKASGCPIPINSKNNFIESLFKVI